MMEFFFKKFQISVENLMVFAMAKLQFFFNWKTRGSFYGNTNVKQVTKKSNRLDNLLSNYNCNKLGKPIFEGVDYRKMQKQKNRFF